MIGEKSFSVLIVEDEYPARQKLVNFLSRRSELSLLDTAKNGVEALQKLSEKKYDLLLLDVHLPALSGIEVIEQSKQSHNIIFTTGYEKYKYYAKKVGAIDFLIKPFSKERFNIAVDKFLEAMAG